MNTETDQPDISLVKKEGLPTIKELLAVQTPESVDQKYYDRLRVPLGTDLEDIFAVTIEEGKARFKGLEVTTGPDGLKRDPIEQNLTHLRNVANEIRVDNDFIKDEELRGLVKHSYLMKINEKIAIWTIAKNYREFSENRNIYEVNGILSEKESEFVKAQKTLYKLAFGQPNKEYFNQARSAIRFELDRVKSENPEVIAAISKVKELIGGSESRQLMPTLSREEMQIYKEALLQRYIVDIDPDKIVSERPDGLLDQSAQKEVVLEAWKKNGLLAFGYNVINASGSSSSVSHLQGNEPGDRGRYRAGKNLSTVQETFDTVSHESTHAMKAVYGELFTGLMLLKTGTFGYLAFEEGVAQTSGSIYADTSKPDVMSYWRYVVSGLVWGNDEAKSNFGFAESQGLCELLLFIDKAGVNGMPTEEAWKYAKETAVSSNIRNFRGVPIPIGGVPEVKGVCSTKDTVYFHGNLRLARFLKQFPDLSKVDLTVLIAGGKVSLDTSDLLLLEKLGIIYLSENLRKKYLSGSMVAIRGQ